MVHYKSKTFFENTHSLNKLIEFRRLVEKYFKMVGPNFKIPIIEHEEVSNLRMNINNMIRSIEYIMLAANIDTTIKYRAPLARGGYVETVCILNNMFNLHLYRISVQQSISPQDILDLINRAIGVYSDDKIWSAIRTFNPILYFIRFLEFMFNTPFSLLKNVGFNTQKIENSFIVRIIKFIYLCVGFLVSVLTLLNLLGYLEIFKEDFKYFIQQYMSW